MSVPGVRVTIELDKPRTLVMSMNAFCSAEEILGFGLMNEVRFEEMRVVRALLWAGLIHEDPSLTLAEAGRLADIAPGGWPYVSERVSLAIEASQPNLNPDEEDDDEEKADPDVDPFRLKEDS